MEAYRKIKLVFSVVSAICLLSILHAQAQMPAADEWVDIPVVVNVIGASDSSSVDEAVRKANEILAGAHIRLIVIKTIYNVYIGEGDESLDESERKEVKEDGQQELAQICSPGRGIKIIVADDVWAEEPDVRGWTVLRKPVVFVEPDDPNTMGNVTAHVIGHSLGIEDHSPDPNNIMYELIPRGSDWDPNDANEVFYDRAIRGSGRVDLFKPENIFKFLLGRPDMTLVTHDLPEHGFEYLQEFPVWGPLVVTLRGGFSAGVDLGVGYDTRGVEQFRESGNPLDLINGCFFSDLDAFNDQDINDPCGVITGPNDPTIEYTDLREVYLFRKNPFDPNAETRVEIELGGPWPDTFGANSFFDIFVSEPNGTPVGRFHIEIGTHIGESGYWENFALGGTVPLLVQFKDDTVIDGSGEVIDGHRVVGTGPNTLPGLVGPGNSEFFQVRVELTAEDYRQPTLPPIVVQDFVGPFAFPLIHTLEGPCISFVPWGIAGWGFGTDKDVGIEIDGEVIDTVTTKANGSFIWFMEPEAELETGPHAVIVKELDDSGPAGAAYATGYFIYCPEGPVAGDFDNDCDVDFHDFAIFADDWLKGTTLP